MTHSNLKASYVFYIVLLLGTMLFAAASVVQAENANENALYSAAGNGYIGDVEWLLGEGVDPNIPDHNGWTAVHHAADATETKVLTALFNAGGNPNVKDFDALTPLHLAANCSVANKESQSILSIDILLRHGAVANVVDQQGNTPLHFAVGCQQSPEGIEALMQAGANPNARASQGYTPLIIAINEANNRDTVSVVKALLAGGAGPNGSNFNDLYPLHWALMFYSLTNDNRHEQIITALLDGGADPNLEDSDGFIPLDFIDYYNFSATGESEVVPLLSILLEYGADPNLFKDNSMSQPWPPLMMAVAAGNLKVIKLLLSRGANPMQRNGDGMTALDFALIYYPSAELDLLIQHSQFDIDVNVISESGVTLLHHILGMTTSNNFEPAVPSFRNPMFVMATAAENIGEKVIKLLDLGLNPNLLILEDWNALHVLTWYGDDETAISAFIAAGTDVNKASDFLNGPKGTPLLYEITRNGRINVVRLLLEANAKPDAADGQGMTALHHAVKNDRQDIVSALLDAHADVNVGNQDGRRPLHTAAEYDNLEIVKILLDAGADPNVTSVNGRTPLHTAADVDRLETVEALLDAGADPNVMAQGGTPLHAAVRNASPAVTSALLRAGSDPKIVEPYLGTPLHIASTRESPGHVEVLLKAGVNPNELNFWASPLHLAARSGSVNTLAALLGAGANPNAMIEFVGTPLHYASARGDLPIVLALLNASSNPNATNDKGRTPLHEAAMAGNSTVVATLLNYGSNPNATDIYSVTPLHFAAQNGGPAMVLALINAGANPNLVDRDGMTATEHANDPEVARILRLRDEGGATVRQQFHSTSCEGVGEQTSGVVSHACSYEEDSVCSGISELHNDFVRSCESELRDCHRRMKEHVEANERQLEMEGKDGQLAYLAYLGEQKLGGFLGYSRNQGLHWSFRCWLDG